MGRIQTKHTELKHNEMKASTSRKHIQFWEMISIHTHTHYTIHIDIMCLRICARDAQQQLLLPMLLFSQMLLARYRRVRMGVYLYVCRSVCMCVCGIIAVGLCACDIILNFWCSQVRTIIIIIAIPKQSLKCDAFRVSWIVGFWAWMRAIGIECLA